MKKSKKIISLVLAIVITVSCVSSLFSCGGDNGPVIDNESTRLVLSSMELNGVFNPF